MGTPAFQIMKIPIYGGIADLCIIYDDISFYYKNGILSCWSFNSNSLGPPSMPELIELLYLP